MQKKGDDLAVPKFRFSANLRGVLWMILAMAAGIFIDLGVKLVDPMVPVAQIVWMRALTSLLLFLPAVAWWGYAAIRMRRFYLQILRGVLWYGTLFLIFFALRQMSIAEVNAYLFLEALFTVLLAALFLRERLTKRKIIAVVLGLIGVWIMCAPKMHGLGTPVGIVAALGAAFLFALQTLLSKVLTLTENNFSMLFWPQVFALIMMAPFALPGWVQAGLNDWILITLAGIMAMITNYCFLRAMRVAEASVVSPAGYSALPFAVIVDLVFFDLLPQFTLLLGAGLIIVAVLSIDLREKKTTVVPASATPEEF